MIRAKRTDNGEWITGQKLEYGGMCLVVPKDTRWSYHDSTGSCLVSKAYEVQSDTVCRPTGQTDRNGYPIWENDICMIEDGCLDREDGPFVVTWNDDTASFELDGCGLIVTFDNVFGKDCEVAGSIFDNQKLLTELEFEE